MHCKGEQLELRLLPNGKVVSSQSSHTSMASILVDEFAGEACESGRPEREAQAENHKYFCTQADQQDESWLQCGWVHTSFLRISTGRI